MGNPFEQFQTDTIRIISKDGNNTSANLKAHVTPVKISLYDLSVDIFEGDFVERDLPNNRAERYEILEANYHDKFQVIPAHYILKVRKTTAIKPSNQTKTVYNLHGNNSRVYNHSQDHSSNIINESNNNVFNQLKQVVNDNIGENTILLTLLSEMEEAKGKPNYLDKYSAFIANAANHMTLITPFIPALTAFIPGH